MKKLILSAFGILFLFGACTAILGNSNPNPQTASTAPAAPGKAAAPAPSPAAPRTYTMQDFDRLKNGMSQAEAEKLLGKGKTVSKSSMAGTEMLILQWTNPDGFTNITATLMNGQVSSVAQIGLK